MMENDHQQQGDGEEREAEFTMSLSCLNVYQNHRPAAFQMESLENQMNFDSRDHLIFLVSSNSNQQ